MSMSGSGATLSSSPSRAAGLGLIGAAVAACGFGRRNIPATGTYPTKAALQEGGPVDHLTGLRLRCPISWRPARSTGSIDSSRRRVQRPCGCRTSPTWRPESVSSMWLSSLLSSLGASSDGAFPEPPILASCSTPWSRPCTSVAPSRAAVSCITATEVRRVDSGGRRNTDGEVGCDGRSATFRSGSSG